MDHQLPNELCIFDEPSMSAPYQKVQYVEYRTASTLNDGGPLHFIIPPTANQFIDLRRTLLHVEARIMRPDDTVLKTTDVVLPVNLSLHSFFSQVDVELQQQLVCSNQHYGYKATIETLLDQNAEALNTHLRSQGFVKDTADAMEPAADVRGSKAFAIRFAMFGASKKVDLEGPLLADIFQQDRMLLNGVELNIKLWPARDRFTLLSASEELDFKIVLDEVYLKVCKVTPTNAIMFAMSETLKEKQALYPFVRTEVRAFHLQTGQYNFHLEDLYQQNVPSEMIVCMVDAEAYHGTFLKNPYNFQTFDLSQLALYVDDESVPCKPLKMNFEKNIYVQAYNTLFENPGEKNPCSITREEFDSGYAIFRFRLTPDDVESLPNTRGNVKLSGRFSVALTTNVTLIVVGKFRHMLKIDNSRSIEQ